MTTSTKRTTLIEHCKNEVICQKLFDEFINTLDSNYNAFVNRETPYNKKGCSGYGPECDDNWEEFYSRAQKMGNDTLIKMGLTEYEVEDMNKAYEWLEDEEDFEITTERYTKNYNKPVAEVLNVIYRIILELSDKYVYVKCDEAHIHPAKKPSKKQLAELTEQKDKLQPYIDEIVKGITDEVLDELYDNGEEDLVSDEQLSLLFSNKFKEGKEYLLGGDNSIGYDVDKAEMVLYSSYDKCTKWSVKCDINNVKSIIDCAIECINHNLREKI